MEAQQCDGLLNSVCTQLGVDSEQYVNRTNIELQKCGTMGFSILVCTQDEGAPSDNNDDCSEDDTQPVWPIYPSSSPWVTAVGATTIYQASAVSSRTVSTSANAIPLCQQIMCNNATDEKVAMSPDMDTLFTSGGGFSNYTIRPSYQDAAVLGYLKGDGLRPPDGKFGVNNRGYPDISAAGSQMFTVLNGNLGWNGGTSASTPIFAGIVSLLNDFRLNNNKSPLGFLNYLLYEMGTQWPQAYNYITVGNNTCTGWEADTCCRYGYSAVAGWNPAVGFGTPNFQQMLKYISQLP
jgi:tripeptidyl-peptidase-1